jgi:serine O-acetyltransferase
MPHKSTKIIQETVERLAEYHSYKSICHQYREGEPLPSVKALGEVIDLVRAIVFPGFFGNSNISQRNIHYYLGVNVDQLFNHLYEQILAGYCFDCKDDTGKSLERHRQRAKENADEFIAFLPELRAIMITDVEAAYLGDPAAHSHGEVIFCYPTIKAITNYRIAHQLHSMGVPLIPRIITELAHSETGIDIHPGAVIGKYFTIDHGTGVVIGATSILGDHVKLYQGVTLGAKSFPLDENGNPIKDIPRHPILEDGVIVYSNATILGRITIGQGATIGGNIWVTEDVPAGARMIQAKTKKNKE